MKIKTLLPFTLSVLILTSTASLSQNLATRREMEKANKEIIPQVVKLIETKSGAKVTLELEPASFAEADQDTWSGLNYACERIGAAMAAVGKDQIGKDALANGVKKIVLVRALKDAKNEVALKDGTLTVKTNFIGSELAPLQVAIQKELEKAL